MANTFDVSRVKQYSDNLRLLYQDKGSILKDTGLQRNPTGKQAFFERLGKTSMSPVVASNQDTIHTNAQLSRRSVTLKDEAVSTLVNQREDVEMLISPASQIMKSQAYAAGRTFDLEIYSKLRGNAQSGEDGLTAVPLPGTQKIAHGGTGLTLGKIIQAAKKLREKNVPMEDVFFITNPAGLEDLLNDNTFTSADHATVRALQTGNLNESFMGFQWRIYNFPIEAGVNYSLAYDRSALGVATWKDMITRITEESTKNFATQVYTRLIFGATRIEEEGVVEIAFQ